MSNYTPDDYGYAPTLAPLNYTMGAVEGGGLLVRSMHGGKLGLSHINLLAAAPDLLAALEMLLNVPEPMTCTEHFDYSANTERLARSAIAKAKGMSL